MEINDFEYFINTNDKLIIAKPVTIEEVDKVISFAKARTVSSENYQKMFGIRCESDFARTGALLETSVDEIYEIIHNLKKYFSIGLWTEESELLAFLFVQLVDEDNFIVNREDMRFRKGFEHKWDEWMELKQYNQLTYKGDIATESESGYQKLLLILFYIAMKRMYEFGKRICITEVFHILKCDDFAGSHIIDVFNERSFAAQVLGGGAIYVGDGKLVKRNISKDVSVEYYAKLLEYDFAKLLPLYDREIEKNNIRIISNKNKVMS